MIRGLVQRTRSLSRKRLAAFAAVFGVIGAIVVVIVFAAGSFVGFEPESGTLTSGATVVSLSGASGGKAIQFGAAATPTPAPMPSAAPTPTPPGGSGCVSDITIPGSWPSSCSTGASGTLTNVSGDIILGNANQVYQNMRVNGTIAVTACNVTLKNVEVDTGEPFTGNSTPDLFAIWLQVPENCNTTLDHVSIITKAAPNIYVTTGVRIAYGGPVTMTDSKIIGVQIGAVGVGAGTFQGNYMVLGPNMRDDHNEDIEVDGSTGLTFIDNTFLNPNDQTATLALFTENGSNKNMLVENNLLAGGGYTCYCGDGASDNAGNPARSVNVSFVNNVFWKLYFPNVGGFGPARAYNPAGGGVWQNNVYMNASGALTSTQVPQPPLDGQ